MKSTIITGTVLIIFIITGCKAKSQQNDYTNQFIKECSAFFSKDNYSLQRKIEVSSNQLGDNPWASGFKNAGLSNATMLVYTSPKTVQGQFKLGFKVLVFQYKSPSDATSKFKEIDNVKKTQGESILSKDWDYVLIQDRYIIRLDAGCLYTKETWKKLKEDFLGTAKKVFNELSEQRIECECGGNCY
jgi:hypothetical protein